MLMFILYCFLLDCNKYYDVESGEIIHSRFSRTNIQRFMCMYTIKVPVGRRITVDVVEGNSIVQTCGLTNGILQGDDSKEKLLVSGYVLYRS